MILAIIVGCEIGFWALIVLGLTARYVLRLKRTGVVLLAMTLVVDLVLLAATVVDLMAGATVVVFHGIAALYLGFSVAYGRKMISWADIRFAHRFADGPAPSKHYGRQYADACWRDVLRTTLAVAIAAGLLWSMMLLVDDVSQTSALSGLHELLGIVFAVELIWAICYTVWPKVERAPTRA